MKSLVLKIVTPSGQPVELVCTSVRFEVPDGKRVGGGSVGIRPGHADALMSVARGRIRAVTEAGEAFDCIAGPGLAIVTGSCVTILSDGMDG